MSLTTATPGPPAPAEPPAHPGDRVSDLIQKLVAAATAEMESAAQRARAQAEAEMTELQRTLDRLREELQAERDRLKSTAGELSASRADAVRLAEELQTERAEKARFAAAIETIRLVVSGVDAELHSGVPAPAAAAVAEADDQPGRHEITGEIALGESESREESIDDDREADDHLSQLLSQIEEIYRADLKSAEGTSDVVARLAANLEYARDVHARRIESDGSDDAAQFDRRLAALIEARANTPFGRHLELAIRRLDRGMAFRLEQQAP